MSVKCSLPPETFRVHPWAGDPAFFVVSVSKTLRGMRGVIRRHMGETAPPRLTACCYEASATRPDYKPLLGFLFFARTHLGAGIVAHEMAHAAFRACERKQVKVRHWVARKGPWGTPADLARPEERFCDALERLNAQFWREAYARKLA